ncbi:MAG: YdcF family protein [Bacteroidetes bacterium]|nr:YdcF family protein [Bacteroidota bacterium]MBU1720876.1 YdcF family protein [Bacteroidota bacterium]
MARKKACYTPTRFGCVVFLFAIFLTSVVFVLTVHSFLTVNRTVEANILVVEGWTPDYATEAAVAEFTSKPYDFILVPGTPIDKGSFLVDFKNMAEVCKQTMLRLGIPEEKVIALPMPQVRKDRTYASACYVMKWLLENNVPVKGINLVTLDCHGRRSRLLYHKVFRSGCQVGVISVADERYNPSRWWSNSSGVRTVIDELVAWLYAMFLFNG